jgi:N-formylglutamate deformylase
MNSRLSYPGWTIFHVPHDSKRIPDEVRNQFVLDDVELGAELCRMTDHHTLELFTFLIPEDQIVCAPVSRLVVDVERFENDAEEPMAGRGLGVIYSYTSDLGELRRVITDEERRVLLERYYHPHHLRLTQSVDSALSVHDKCLIVDCHSFPSHALPYEFDSFGKVRPDICLGTDDFHTPPELTEQMLKNFEKQGFSVALNSPFAGALVPMKHYRKDQNVQALMIEVNRALYCDEKTGVKGDNFGEVSRLIREALGKAYAHATLSFR